MGKLTNKLVVPVVHNEKTRGEPSRQPALYLASLCNGPALGIKVGANHYQMYLNGVLFRVIGYFRRPGSIDYFDKSVW